MDPLGALGLVEDPLVKPKYEEFSIGSRWDAPWDRTWFEFKGAAPDSLDEAECVIDLGWEDHSVGFQ